MYVGITDPGEGTPSMLGDMDVPPFWPPFLTFGGLNSIFLGYFFSSTNTKTIFWVLKLLILAEFDLFGPKFHFSLNLFGSNFQRPAAPLTPPPTPTPTPHHTPHPHPTPPPPPPPPPHPHPHPGHRRPQTLAEMCGNMCISYVFRSVAARVKYPGFMYICLLV